MREQVEPQVGVSAVTWRTVQVRDHASVTLAPDGADQILSVAGGRIGAVCGRGSELWRGIEGVNRRA
jgi:hypothetical protein